MWLETACPALLMATLVALCAGAAGAMPVCAGSGSIRGDSQTECQLLGRVFRSTPHSFLPGHARSVLVSMETVHSMRRSLRSAKRRKRSIFSQPSWNNPTQSTGSRPDEAYCTTETTLQIPLLARSCHTDDSVQLVQSPPLSVQPVLVSVCLPKQGVDNATCQQAYAPQMLLRSVDRGSARFELVWVESGCQVTSAMKARQRQQHMNFTAHAPIAAAAQIIDTHNSARDIIHADTTLKHTMTTIRAAESPRTSRPAEKSPLTDGPAEESPRTERPADESPRTDGSAVESPRTDRPAVEPPRTNRAAEESPRTNRSAVKSPRTDRPAVEPPRTERPADESPRTDGPAVESPRTDRPAVEPPRTDRAAEESPRTNRPAVESPRTNRPADESPRTNKPADEPPRADRSADESPRTNRPAVESPRTNRPADEPPRTDRSADESPRTNRPAVESPRTDRPAFESQRTDRPAFESPRTDRPAVESPRTDRPVSEFDRANLTDSRVFQATGKLLIAEEVPHDAAADILVSDRVTTETGAGTPAGAYADVPVSSTLVPERLHKLAAATNYLLDSFAVPIAAKRASDPSGSHSAADISSGSLIADTEAGVTGSYTKGSSFTATRTSSNTQPQTRSQHISETSALADTETATTPITEARSEVTDPATGASETVSEVVVVTSTTAGSGGSQARAYGILSGKKPLVTTPGLNSTGGEMSRKPDGNKSHVVVQTMMYTDTSGSTASSSFSIPASSDAASASIHSFERLAWPNSRLASNSSYLRTIRKYLSGYNKHAGRSSKTSVKQDTTSTAPRRLLSVLSTTVRTNGAYVGNLNEEPRRRTLESASYPGQATTELPEDLILDALASEAVTEAYNMQKSTSDRSSIDKFGRISSSGAAPPYTSTISPPGLVFNGASEMPEVPVDVQLGSTVWSDNKQIFFASNGESRQRKSTLSEQQLQSANSISAQSRARKSVVVTERVAAGVSDLTVQREDWQAVRRVVAAYMLGARSCGRQSSATGSIEAAHTLLLSLLGQQRVTTAGGSAPLCKARTAAAVRRMLQHERRLMAEQHEKLRQMLVEHLQQSEDALQQRILQLHSGSADILLSDANAPTRPDVKLDLSNLTASGVVSGDRKRGQTRQLQLDQPECALYEQSNTDGQVINELNYLIDTLLGFSVELYLTFIPAEPLSRSAQSVPTLSLPQYLDLRQSRVLRLISGSLRLYSAAISDLHEPILALETITDLIQSHNSSDGPTAEPTEEEILQRLPTALYGMVLNQLSGMPGFVLEVVDSPNFVVPALVAFSEVDPVPVDSGSHSLVLRLAGLLRRLWAVWRIFFNELIRPALRVRLQLQDNSRRLSLPMAQLTSVVTERLSLLPADVRQIVCNQLNSLLQLELTVNFSIGDLKQLISQLVELLQLLGGVTSQELQPFSQLSLVLQLSNGALDACYAFVIGLIEETTTKKPSILFNTTIPSAMPTATASSTGSFVTGVSTASPSTASSTLNSMTVSSSTNFVTGTSNVVTDFTGSTIPATGITIVSNKSTGTNIASTMATGITTASTTATDTSTDSITANSYIGISTAVSGATELTTTEFTIAGTSSASLLTESTTAASLVTESTIAGTTAAPLSTESTIVGTTATPLVTESTIAGATAASFGTDSTIAGTSSASLVTESTIAGATAVSLGTASTIADTTSASIVTDSTSAPSLVTDSTIAGTTAASHGKASTIADTTSASIVTDFTIAGTTSASFGTDSTITGMSSTSLVAESTISGTTAASLATASTIAGTSSAFVVTESTITDTTEASFGTKSTIADTSSGSLVLESTTNLQVSTSTIGPSADVSLAVGVLQFTLAAADLTAAVTVDSDRVAPIVNKHDLPTLDEILL